MASHLYRSVSSDRIYLFSEVTPISFWQRGLHPTYPKTTILLLLFTTMLQISQGLSSVTSLLERSAVSRSHLVINFKYFNLLSFGLWSSCDSLELLRSGMSTGILLGWLPFRMHLSSRNLTLSVTYSHRCFLDSNQGLCPGRNVFTVRYQVSVRVGQYNRVRFVQRSRPRTFRGTGQLPIYLILCQTQQMK